MPLVRIKNFPSRAFAELAHEMLANDGIPSWVQCADVDGGTGWPVPESADLYVDEQHAADASELVSALFGDV